jgi:hypothetical protein
MGFTGLHTYRQIVTARDINSDNSVEHSWKIIAEVSQSLFMVSVNGG